jgi:transcriptional regulator with XRE-family HTH domain
MKGKDLKEIRKKTGMSRSQFSDLIGVSIHTLDSWESEKRNIPKLKEEIILLKTSDNVHNTNSVTGNKNNNIVNVNSSGEVDRLKEENKMLNQKLLECQEKLIDLLSKNT